MAKAILQVIWRDPSNWKQRCFSQLKNKRTQLLRKGKHLDNSKTRQKDSLVMLSKSSMSLNSKSVLPSPMPKWRRKSAEATWNWSSQLSLKTTFLFCSAILKWGRLIATWNLPSRKSPSLNRTSPIRWADHSWTRTSQKVWHPYSQVSCHQKKTMMRKTIKNKLLYHHHPEVMWPLGTPKYRTWKQPIIRWTDIAQSIQFSNFQWIHPSSRVTLKVKASRVLSMTLHSRGHITSKKSRGMKLSNSTLRKQSQWSDTPRNRQASTSIWPNKAIWLLSRHRMFYLNLFARSR